MAINPTWTSDVQPGLQYLKAGCPTAYTYPYDDKSSTFTCSVMSGGNNVVNYDIVWCPLQASSPSSTPSPTNSTPKKSSSGTILQPTSLAILLVVVSLAALLLTPF